MASLRDLLRCVELALLRPDAERPVHGPPLTDGSTAGAQPLARGRRGGQTGSLSRGSRGLERGVSEGVLGEWSREGKFFQWGDRSTPSA